MKKTALLPFLSVTCLFSLIFLLSSCQKEEPLESDTYFGVTIKYFKDEHTPGTDQSAFITQAYDDCFQRHGIISQQPLVLSPSASREQILEACKEAETALITSSVKFSGYYEFAIWTEKHNATYEIQETEVIYRQTYGVRLSHIRKQARYENPFYYQD